MIAFISDLLREVGDLLLDQRSRTREIEFKIRHSDLVTDADRLSEDRLLRAIRREYPQDAILSEESGIHPGSSEFTWVVDPLDGTANFASGLPDFGIILGRLRNDEPIFGAMYLPASDLLYLAERGGGAARNGEPISVCEETELSSVLIDHSFHFRDDPERMEGEMRAFHSIWPHVRGVRSSGCLLYLAQLAEGQLGAFVANEVSLWDLAGPSVILEEAGARVTDLDGRRLDLSYDAATWQRPLQAIGANPQLHAELLARVLAAR